MVEMSRSRQAIHAAAKRATRGAVPLGRPRWQCPDCNGTARIRRKSGERVCATCHPARKGGRPRKNGITEGEEKKNP
jgi:hypothetical protein